LGAQRYTRIKGEEEVVNLKNAIKHENWRP
jgi:hypothetical protein